MFTHSEAKLSTEELTNDELKKLNDFLSFAWKDKEKVMLTETHGFFTAIVSAPHLILPSIWQPLALGEDAAFTSMEEASDIITLLSRFYNKISRQLEEGKLEPLLFDGDEEKKISLKDVSTPLLSVWCQGYIQGTTLDPLWCDKASDLEFQQRLLPLFVLAQDPHGKTAKIIRDMEEEDFDLYEHNQQFMSTEKEKLRELICYLFDYWAEKRKLEVPLPTSGWGDQEDEHSRQDGLKHGRNAPCPCGSQKKYKKCCGSTEKTWH